MMMEKLIIVAPRMEHSVLLTSDQHIIIFGPKSIIVHSCFKAEVASLEVSFSL